MARHSERCERMITRVDALLAGWHAERVGFATLVSTLESVVLEIPHDRFQRECERELFELECVNATTLAHGTPSGFTESDAVIVGESIERITKFLDRARRQIDDPCRDGQSCRS